ncbi:MAG: flagellar hook length determination-like protein [Phenylobacterium sp.]|nr:flagellar hook length determination-like protein [Phenylobacterium sp.]
MSASAINAATPPTPGPAAGIGAGASQGQEPQAGFEALLASFFGLEAQPGAAAPAGKTGKTDAAGVALAEGGEGAGEAAVGKTPDEIKAAEAAAAALAACNAGLAIPVTVLPIAAAPTPSIEAATGEDAGKTSAAAGTGKGFAATAGAMLLKDELSAEAASEAADTKAAATAAIDPNASAPRTIAKLDSALAAPLAAAAPNVLTAAAPPPAAPTPASAPPPAVSADIAAEVVAQAVPAPQAAAAAASQVKVTEQTPPVAPTAPKDKAQGAKAGRNPPGGVDPAAATLAKTGALAFAPVADGAPQPGADDYSAVATAADLKTEAPEAPAGSAGSTDAASATASTTSALTQVHPGVIPVRGSPQTVANLAAQIAKKLEGRSTRFDLELNPQGLGRVDVRMEIGATGRMSAAMTFDTPAAAAELRARAAELQRHLEQAGFDMSGGLSFDVAGDRGQGRQAQNQDNPSGQAFRGRAFQDALATAGEAAQSAVSGALNLRRGLLAGVDIRI